MPRLSTLPQIQRNMLVTRAIEMHDSAPRATLRRPLSDATVAVVTSAGIHCRDDRPFGREDPTLRVIPSDARPGDLLQSHSSLAFDKTAFIRDVNVVFPIDRLAELVAEGRVGRVGPRHYSVMGALPDMTRLREDTAPELAARLVDDGVDVVILTPT
ncbi:MAG: glycine/betaine/sarcosine/D-proline family reductase selenoprotein B [Actinobacteria bacterium]|nr:glycine/betaine/sarcosine/D-proline family reductase selenoprotein B [Actinomycetota bacterium]